MLRKQSRGVTAKEDLLTGEVERGLVLLEESREAEEAGPELDRSPGAVPPDRRQPHLATQCRHHAGCLVPHRLHQRQVLVRLHQVPLQPRPTQQQSHSITQEVSPESYAV